MRRCCSVMGIRMYDLFISVVCNTFVVALSAIDHDRDAELFPVFDNSTVNLTVVSGETARLPCEVKYIGKHRVAWISPSNTVLTSLDQRITDDSRISIERHFTREWNLHIRNIRFEDRGEYTCSINTMPIQEKKINLEVLVPAEIIDEWTSRKIVANEGDTVQLLCNATGIPAPTVTWFKETNQYGAKQESITEPGEILVIHNVSRFCDGVFRCEASNNVGFPVSREIIVEVLFPPEVSIRPKRLGQYRGRETILECHISASPLTQSVWLRNGAEVKSKHGKYRIEGYNGGNSPHSITLSLHIMNIGSNDYGVYTCYASNALGKDTEEMVLYESYTTPPRQPVITPSPTSRDLAPVDLGDGSGKNRKSFKSPISVKMTESTGSRLHHVITVTETLICLFLLLVL